MSSLYERVKDFAREVSREAVVQEIDPTRAAYVEALRRKFPECRIGHDASNRDCVIVMGEDGEEVIVRILVEGGGAVKMVRHEGRRRNGIGQVSSNIQGMRLAERNEPDRRERHPKLRNAHSVGEGTGR